MAGTLLRGYLAKFVSFEKKNGVESVWHACFGMPRVSTWHLQMCHEKLQNTYNKKTLKGVPSDRNWKNLSLVKHDF